MMSQSAITQSQVDGYSVKEEILNAVTHAVGVIFSIIGLISLLATNTVGEFGKQVCYSIYGASMIALFTASTLYHAVTHPTAKSVLKMVDHCAIYLLIAGSYTPLLFALPSSKVGNIMLVIIWSLAAIGIAFKLVFKSRFKVVSLATYLGMGFAAVFILPDIYQMLPAGGLWLLGLGGAAYTFGVFFYVQKKKQYTHAIWHLFVLAGAGFHYGLIFNYA
ncbi:PAQR family membrane homeostasis protein TrhA [Parashewanella hymeniacidonis]|uniref:PAQR family membrane homeostasis protein TrhA n=1 Tax=Parashewanella hymeniacidonis TaxID=2807618 RepID=UPI001EF4A467|nr:hemolysin III family protein [Parashewanella hymeniacidonis]